MILITILILIAKLDLSTMISVIMMCDHGFDNDFDCQSLLLLLKQKWETSGKVIRLFISYFYVP